LGVSNTVEGSVLLSEKPGGFGEHRPASEKTRGQRRERVNAEAMKAIAFGEKGDQGAGVE
jgi:hypothetical protein